MAKPATLQLLKHGKLLCKSVFPFFVESYNWLLSAFDNLRGDFDVNPKNGAITIDKTDPDHPVIRLRTDNLNLNGGAGVSYPGCFEIALTKVGESSLSMSFSNTYYCVGGKTYFANVSTLTGSEGIVALKLGVSSSAPSATLELYSGFNAIREAQADNNLYIIPLYTIEDGGVTCDWRKGALAAMWEF